MPHGSESVVAPLAARRLTALGAPELYGYPAFRPAPLLIPDAEPGPAPVRNRLLAALPGSELALLEPYLEPVWLEQRAQLFSPDRPIGHVYFPDTAVISLVSRLDDGRTVEVGTAGFEGMAGLSLFLAEDTSSFEAFAQIPGTVHRMEAQAFVRMATASASLHRMLLRYTQAFLTQVAQTAACNGAHLVEERCARWLLHTNDRVDGDEFALTHEFLAFMLGVRRAGVTVTLRALQDAGIIAYGRGRIAIVDRSALEAVSCECYRVFRDHFERLLPGRVPEHDALGAESSEGLMSLAARNDR